ncbi:MAG: ClbS/DfsB family four-helix bundle protein [Chloroflexota bacterium]
MKDKTELLSEIEREWKALIDVVNQLTPQQMVTPDAGGWSPKDNLAHLTEWMTTLMGYHMDGRPSHEVMNLDPADTEDWDMDIINARLFERNKERPVEEVLAGLKSKYAELTARLEAMPFEDLLKPRWPDDPEKRPLVNWILGDSSEHFAEHREVIEQALSKKSKAKR